MIAMIFLKRNQFNNHRTYAKVILTDGLLRKS